MTADGGGDVSSSGESDHAAVESDDAAVKGDHAAVESDDAAVKGDHAAVDGHYDVVVVGVGGMGSAAALELARRGRDVLALERFDIPHARGSSHGYSRIVSRSFYDRGEYMPVYDRACERWEDIEDEWGRQVFYRDGSLTTGEPGTEIVSTARRTAERFDVPHERLTPEKARERFPGYRIPDSHEVVFQPTDGFLVPRDGVCACVDLAHAHGAEIHARTQVQEWTADEGGVTVETDRGDATADDLVVTAGAWTPAVLPVTRDVLEAERQVLGRFRPADPAAGGATHSMAGRFGPDAFSVSAITTENGQYSAFPAYGSPGVKLARVHHREETVDPDEMDMAVTAADEAVLRWFGDRYLAGGTGPTMRLETCLYTNTPDRRFVVDTHPDHPRVHFAGGFSGHGYKFCPVIAEILADLVEGRPSGFDLAPFRFDRF